MNISSPTLTAPPYGRAKTATELDPALSAALLAQSWAQQWPAMTGLVIILSRRRSGRYAGETWFRSHFIVKDAQARRMAVGNAKELTANGVCPHCGTVVLERDLLRAFGPHPRAGEILMPPKGVPQCVGKTGATYACSACIKANGWRTDIAWNGDVKTPPETDSEIPNSKLTPIVCALPGKFAWHRDLPYYVEINLMDGTIDVRKEFTA